MKYSVGIIGGGAAGLTAAIAAAEKGAKVTVLERNDRPGKKLLSTGNGRCNLGNENLSPGNYYTTEPDFLEGCLKRFGTAETKAFFGGIGLMIKSRNGYLYPVSEQASAVLDVLRYQVYAQGTELVTDCEIEGIEKNRGNGKIHVWGNGKTFSFDRVILACGGRAAPKTGSDGSGYLLAEQLGHRIIPTVPALVQLKCREDYLKSVTGVRTDALVTVLHRGKELARERGELQLTDYGISGIPVFQVSRLVNYILKEEREAEIVIDFLPDETRESFEALCGGRIHLQRNRTVEEFFTGILHKKLMMLFIRLAGLRPQELVTDVDRNKIRQVYRLCRQWKVHVTGSNSYDNAQVCAGGVPLNQVTTDLESKKVPGIYFAGEILDVDGKCGGYNLQWAWCSGYLAGCAAAGAEFQGNDRRRNEGGETQ